MAKAARKTASKAVTQDMWRVGMFPYRKGSRKCELFGVMKVGSSKVAIQIDGRSWFDSWSELTQAFESRGYSIDDRGFLSFPGKRK